MSRIFRDTSHTSYQITTLSIFPRSLMGVELSTAHRPCMYLLRHQRRLHQPLHPRQDNTARLGTRYRGDVFLHRFSSHPTHTYSYRCTSSPPRIGMPLPTFPSSSRLACTRSVRLMKMFIFSKQQGCCCVASLGCNTTTGVLSHGCIYIAVPCASTTMLCNLLCTCLLLVFIMRTRSSAPTSSASASIKRFRRHTLC